MVIVIKRGIVYLGLGLSIILIALSISHTKAPAAQFTHENHKCIIIDPGHGFPDGGAVSSSGTLESDLNIEIAEKLSRELTERGYKTVMTRTDKNGLDKKKKSDMNMRLNIMKNTPADIFVSIHINKFHQSKYRGAEILYSSNFNQSALLAQMIMTKIKSIDPDNQTRSIKEAERTLFLMKNATIPAVIVECGFISNPSEELLLKSPDYQSRLAAAICDGILSYYDNINNYEKSNFVKGDV